MFDEFDKMLKTFSDKYSSIYNNSKDLSDGIHFWRGKPIISTEEWFKISKANTISDKNDYNVEEGLKYIPNAFVKYPWPLGIPEDLIEQANQWLKDYYEYLEFIHDDDYRKHFYPTQEEIENDGNRRF
jgi:hypothetical protein